MLQLASSQGPLQSLFCSCPNTLSALTETETPLTKNSNALAENSTALCPVPPQEGRLGGGSWGSAGWTTGWRGIRSQQQTGAGRQLFRGGWGEAEIMSPLSPSPGEFLGTNMVLQASTYLVRSVPGAREGPTPSARTPKGCIPECPLWIREDVHVPGFTPWSLAMPCAVTPVGMGGCEEMWAELGRGTRFLVGEQLPGLVSPCQVCVAGGLRLL